MTWRSTGVALAALPEGGLREVAVGTGPVLLVRSSGEVRAFDPYCPHEGGVLAEGTVEKGRLTCPLHQAAFDLRSGRVLADPHAVEPPTGGVEPLLHHPVRVVGGMIEVDLG